MKKMISSLLVLLSSLKILTKTISISLNPKLISDVDLRRGLIPRSVYIAKLLETSLKSQELQMK